MIPKAAIVDTNTLAMLGLKQILQAVMPFMQVDMFGSMQELTANEPDNYVHYFVSANFLLAHHDFFRPRRNKTIVLTTSASPEKQLNGFNYLCVNVPEKQLVRSILAMEQRAHAHGKNLPDMPKAAKANVLSNREIEVLALIAQGFLNKEIADRLHVSITTVISHRKNLMEKLQMKSVSALTIYAVMHGYVDIGKI